MEGRLWSKPSYVLSSHTGRPTQKDATSRFLASLAFRLEIFDRIGGWPLTKRGDFDQQLIARLHAIDAPGAPLNSIGLRQDAVPGGRSLDGETV